MKVNLKWLKELVEIDDIPVSELVEMLSLHSIEVETATKFVDSNNLVVGHVESSAKLEDSDKLSLCSVNIGTEVLQIICGAPNVSSGQNVIVALPGAVLPGDFKIKKSKIRGVESNGMICSLAELGIDKKYIDEENQNGIYVFKEAVRVGEDALKALEMDDYIIELGLTPNRGDLLSMLGVAIEVSAVLNRPLKEFKVSSLKAEFNKKIAISSTSSDCILYYGRLFEDVQIKASPRWLISRLIAFGIRPINNVVDITNYILALFGQPLHAFDFDKLGNKVVIRKAKANEVIITLDKQKRVLEVDDLVITDGLSPVAIAGVMGGLETEVTNKTKSILLEAAVFEKNSVRKTATRLDLRSDSSMRFERGVDSARTLKALEYASYLLKEYASAKVGNLEVDKELIVKPRELKLTESDVERLLGIKISKEDIKSILERLQFRVSKDLEVIVPSHRNDISIVEDLVEEVVRIYGYEHLPSSIPFASSVGGLNTRQVLRRKIKSRLQGLGLNEVVNYSLQSDLENKMFVIEKDSKKDKVELLMPLSRERKELRKSLVPGLIAAASYNYNRQNKDLAFFEVGNIYYKNESFIEEEHLGLLLTNDFSKSLGHVVKTDFFLIKGIIENLFNHLKLELDFKPLDFEVEELHPKRTALIYLDNNLLGYVGAIHPKYAKSVDLDNTYVAEINLSKIYNSYKNEDKFTHISRVPSVSRDIAIVVKKTVLAAEITKVIKSIKNSSISDINIFDIYTGEGVASDEKSVAINLVFSANETMTDDVINSKMKKVLKELEKELNASLR